ncbi:MAG TPA: alpha/beta fold hydrolase [Euzebyales bacterium]|nr:alpha/beta fold hydrolase [Euzebyales bacterium]
MVTQVASQNNGRTTTAKPTDGPLQGVRWPVRRPTAWLAVVLGIVGVALGLGVGARHLQVAGMSLTAAVGLVGLAVGLVATVAGATVLLRGMHGWRRWWALPVGLLLLWFVAVPLTTAVMVTNVPPIEVHSQTPADRGVAYEDVTFMTADGVRLSAWYVPSRNGAAVVLRHGATSTRSDTLDVVVVLAGHGYGVLATDARGHGGSGGVAMDWGWFGDLDTAAAVTFLSQRPEVHADRVGVVGLSMGGEEALGAAAADPRIRAVVAEGVSSRGTVADDDLVLPDHPGRWMNVAQTWIQQHLADLLADASAPTGLRPAVVAVAPRPVLLIVGGDALGGEVTAGRRLQAAAPDSVEVWEVAGAPHIGGLATHPQQWETRVVGFLDRALQ